MKRVAEPFKAHRQYDDWEGTIAADNIGPTKTTRKYLEKNALIEQDEALLCVKLWIREAHGDKWGKARVDAVLFKGPRNLPSLAKSLAGKNVLGVRVVEVPITLQEFLAMFKQFSVNLTPHLKDVKLDRIKYRSETGSSKKAKKVTAKKFSASL